MCTTTTTTTTTLYIWPFGGMHEHLNIGKLHFDSDIIAQMNSEADIKHQAPKRVRRGLRHIHHHHCHRHRRRRSRHPAHMSVRPFVCLSLLRLFSSSSSVRQTGKNTQPTIQCVCNMYGVLRIQTGITQKKTMADGRTDVCICMYVYTISNSIRVHPYGLLDCIFSKEMKNKIQKLHGWDINSISSSDHRLRLSQHERNSSLSP